MVLLLVNRDIYKVNIYGNHPILYQSVKMFFFLFSCDWGPSHISQFLPPGIIKTSLKNNKLA